MCGKLCSFIVLICIALVSSVSSALQPSDCKEFKVIPPDQYDRDASAADDISRRPLGYMFGSAKYPGVQSEGNLKNLCVFLKNLTGRYVEVMVQTLVSGKSVCVRDNKTPSTRISCEQSKIIGCWNPPKDTMIYEFYCDPGKGCDTDVQFWYRLTPSPVGADVDDWCNARNSDEFPESLITGPPPVESKTTVKSAAYSLHFRSIFLTFLPLQLYYFFSTN